MKNQLKRAAALLLAVALLAGMAACGKKEPEKWASRGQIIVFVAQDDVIPTEINQASKVLWAQFADPYALVVQRVTGDALNDSAALLALVQKVVENQAAAQGTIHAAIFAPGFAGTSTAANWLQTQYPDLRVAVCQPGARASSFAGTAALVLDFDYGAMAKAVAAQADAMGAEAFYYLTTSRTGSFEGSKTFHDVLAGECAALGLHFSDPVVRDTLADGKEAAQADIIQCVNQADAKWPDGKFAMYSADRLASETLAVALLQKRAILPGFSGGTPLEGIPAALGVDMLGHETDAAYALAQSAALAESFGLRGSIAAWQVSLPSLMLEIAVRCVNALEPGALPTQAQVEEAFGAAKAALGGEATMTQDAAQANLYSFSCELKGLE
ncbi:MAG: DUF3798 domain-containing protein [Oscillospiraceae bacterium]|jgi:hypothetical protein|nr:DUF3798 domain-containing protein [Oscillospiraceae bacterium]